MPSSTTSSATTRLAGCRPRATPRAVRPCRLAGWHACARLHAPARPTGLHSLHGADPSVPLAGAPVVSPVCPAPISQRKPPVVVAGTCPPNATEYLGGCYAACAAPLTPRANRPDQCLKPCNGTLTSGDGGAVAGSTKCIRHAAPGQHAVPLLPPSLLPLAHLDRALPQGAQPPRRSMWFQQTAAMQPAHRALQWGPCAARPAQVRDSRLHVRALPAVCRAAAHLPLTRSRPDPVQRHALRHGRHQPSRLRAARHALPGAPALPPRASSQHSDALASAGCVRPVPCRTACRQSR